MFTIFKDYRRLIFTGELPSSPEEALQMSIDKWQFIVDHIEEIIDCGDDETCGLCMWHWGVTDGNCGTCQVQERTGHWGCSGTPYVDFRVADNLADRLAAAKAELAFLKTLLDVKQENPDE